MSGGVDSAVALLRAGAGRRRRHAPALDRPERARHRARVLLAARRDRRARDACHARGMPHVTLDLREEFRARRRRSRSSRATRTARRRTRACAATAASASTSCSRSPTASAPRGSRPATTRASSSATAAACSRARPTPRKDQSYMLAARRPGRARPRLVPARRADEGRDARRGRGRRARRRTPAGEPGGVLPRRRRLPRLPRAPRPRGRARAGSSTRRAASSARHDGFWRFTPGQRRGLGIAAAEPLYALGADARTNTVVVGPRASLARRRVEVRGSLRTPARRVEAKLRYRSPALRRVRDAAPGGFALELDEPAYGVAQGQIAVLYDGDAVVGSGVIIVAAADKIAACPSPTRAQRRRVHRADDLPGRGGPRHRLRVLPARRHVRRASRR